MTAGDAENGDELYQDTMLKLLEKKDRLDFMQNTKSYALSTSIFLWKNKRRKYAKKLKLVPIDSIDEMTDAGNCWLKQPERLHYNKPTNFFE